MQSRRSKLTVMMIDDDPLDCMLVKQAFTKADASIEFFSCESSEDALQSLAKHLDDGSLPHGCLLDINMPGHSGIDVLRAMKSDKRFQQIPVIMFSSSDRLEDITACYKSQAAGYIKKPEQNLALQDIISNLAGLWTRHMRFAPAP